MSSVHFKGVVLAMGLVAGSVWADVLTPDNPYIGYSGYAHMTVSPTMARFDRMISKGNSLQYDNPGARVRFRTDATSAVATVSYNDLTTQIVNSVGTILVDGVQTGTFTVGNPRGAVDVPVLTQGTAAFHTVELVMPYWDSVDFTGLTVNAGANFEAVPAKPGIRWVAYGDSITQGGYAAVNPFVEQVARAKGWEAVNMGFGGGGITPSDGVTLGGLGATVITEMMGHNNAGSGMTVETFIANMTSWVSNVRGQQPNVPIYLISPIFTSNPYAPLLASYGPALQNLVTTSGDPNLHYIDGASLGINAGNYTSYMADGAHPNDAGAALIASNLAGQISTDSVVPPPSTVQAAYSNSATAGAYMVDILATDLVNQGRATYASGSTTVAPFGSFTFGGLNDGSGATDAAGANQLKSTFWNGGWPVTLTFNLNLDPATGGCAAGYNISRIQTIGGWTGSFVDQRYTVWVKTVGSSGYVQVGGNFADSSVTSATKSTKTVITDSTGTIASGIESVQLVYSAPVNGTAGALVIQEIDISGAANVVPAPGSDVQATYSNSTTAGAYMADILATDLVNQGQATYASGSTSAPPFNGFTFGGLNDGSGATNTTGANQLKSTFWNAGWPVTLTFDLDVSGAPGTSATGYDITQIQTIGGWTGSFVDQRYTVWVKRVGSSSYVQVGGNFADPAVTGSTCSTKTVITDGTGTIATGVQSVRFVYSAPVNGTSNALVIQEIDVSGVPTVPSYAAWKQGAFATDTQRNDPAISGELATPANDGITNLMKYALGLDPMTCGTANLPTISPQGGELTLTYRKNKQAGDLTYTVQAGDSLTGGNWSTATTVVSQTDAGSYWLVTVRDNVTMAGHPTRFMRLQVSQ